MGIEELLTEYDKKWADEVWEKLDQKLSVVGERSEHKLPFQTADSIHNDMTESNIYCWTNGFWPGLMWLMYAGTGKERYMEIARTGEEKLDRALDMPERLSHDVGFMWKLAAGPDWELTGNPEAKKRLRKAADFLSARFNSVGGFIRAWDWGSSPAEKAGWTIIDTLMNLPLLCWASRETQDPRYMQVALAHYNKAKEHHVRPDGSVKHVCIFDPNTGDYIQESDFTQGYAPGTSWSRGQAWAIYGYTLGYIHTGKQEYLDTAKRVAHYFIANVCNDWLPKCDFRSPKEPVYYDASAGACAACGMIEMAKVLPDNEKELYLRAALNILQALEKNFADWSEDTDFVLNNSTCSYRTEQNVHIIYADYYFAEAIYKLKDLGPLFW